MPYTYAAPTGATASSGITAERERIGDEIVAYDNTADFALSPPADANHAECYAWGDSVSSLTPAVSPDLGAEQGFPAIGYFELEGRDDLTGFRIKGVTATPHNLNVVYYKLNGSSNS